MGQRLRLPASRSTGKLGSLAVAPGYSVRCALDTAIVDASGLARGPGADYLGLSLRAVSRTGGDSARTKTRTSSPVRVLMS